MVLPLDLRFWLQDDAGDRRYPVLMRDNDTRETAYRVSNAGNTKSGSIQLQELEEVAGYVVNRGFSVRACRADGSSPGLVCLSGTNNYD